MSGKSRINKTWTWWRERKEQANLALKLFWSRSLNKICFAGEELVSRFGSQMFQPILKSISLQWQCCFISVPHTGIQMKLCFLEFFPNDDQRSKGLLCALRWLIHNQSDSELLFKIVSYPALHCVLQKLSWVSI